MILLVLRIPEITLQKAHYRNHIPNDLSLLFSKNNYDTSSMLVSFLFIGSCAESSSFYRVQCPPRIQSNSHAYNSMPNSPYLFLHAYFSILLLLRIERRGGGLGSSTIFKNLMSPTPRRKWYLTTGRRAP